MGLVIIDGAAALGTTSHFNVATSAAAQIYTLMGVGAITLATASLVFGVSILGNRTASLTPSMRLAIGLGLVSTFVLTLFSAGAMSAMPGHLVGGNASDTEGLALLGWARDGGDLRVAHFIGTHAMHLIPLGTWLVRGSEGVRRGVAVGLTLLIVALVGFTFAQALGGRPFPGWF